MLAFSHVTLLCAAIRACQSSSLSCETPDAVHESGAALLQLGRFSKSLHGAASAVAEYMELEPFTTAGYEATKKKCCAKDMAEFIDGLAISMGYKICSVGFGPGAAVWHTCNGTGATSTFEKLKNDIIEHSKEPCSSITSASICPNRDSCPDFPHEPLPPCDEVCSKTKAVPLDFGGATVGTSNLAGVGPDSGKQEISYIGIGSIGSPAVPFNMIVTVVRGKYATDKPEYNGLSRKPKYTSGAIGMSAGRTVELKFEFQLADGTPVKLPEFHFTLWDLDGSPESQEYVTMEGFTDYVIDNITDIKVTNEDTTAKVATFSTGPKNNRGDVSMSGTVLVLSEEARKASVMTVYKDVSEFKMTFRKSGPGPSQSAVVFNGACSLEDHCGA